MIVNLIHAIDDERDDNLPTISVVKNKDLIVTHDVSRGLRCKLISKNRFTCPHGGTVSDDRRIMKKEPTIPAVMNVEEGEQIVGAWITPMVTDIGFYKLLAKRRKDGTCEWVHFVQRANGEKDKFYRGEVSSEKDVDIVVASINNTLTKMYGAHTRLQLGNPEVYSLDGKNLDSGTVN